MSPAGSSSIRSTKPSSSAATSVPVQAAITGDLRAGLDRDLLAHGPGEVGRGPQRALHPGARHLEGVVAGIGSCSSSTLETARLAWVSASRSTPAWRSTVTSTTPDRTSTSLSSSEEAARTGSRRGEQFFSHLCLLLSAARCVVSSCLSSLPVGKKRSQPKTKAWAVRPRFLSVTPLQLNGREQYSSSEPISVP